MTENAPAESSGGGELEALGVPKEIQDYAKTMWMVQIIGLGPLYLIFTEKPGLWKNPWFVSQVRLMIRSMIFWIICYLPGMWFAFQCFSAVGKGKDPKVPFAAPNGFADSQK